MVVENARDLAAYEKTGRYEGVYHVLHGAISPAAGIGPNEIRLKELMRRLQSEDVKEVISHRHALAPHLRRERPSLAANSSRGVA